MSDKLVELKITDKRTMLPENKEAYLLDLRCADRLLARHVGPTHTARVELAKLTDWVEAYPVAAQKLAEVLKAR